MKRTTVLAVTGALMMSGMLGACSPAEKPLPTTSSSASPVKETTTPVDAVTDTPATAGAATPTPEELNAILSMTTDPNATVEDKIRTVQGSENAPELFETMTQSKKESGAEFTVVPPLLPGYTPNSVLATVNFTLPDQPPQTIKEVEFVFEDGTWKLAQAWACTLITAAVDADKVPAMCQGDAAQSAAPQEAAK